MRIQRTILTFAWLAAALAGEVRPPATPLITHDPYFSVWSMADQLTAEPAKHWTGTDQPLTGLARIDGKAYRFLGNQPRNTEAMRQTARQLTATRTIYTFEAAGVKLNLTFQTPALTDDLDILSRPVTYVIWRAQSIDGNTHDVALYFDLTSNLAVNVPEQRVVWSRVRVPGLSALRVGTAEQSMLSRSGDNLRIDWGYAYLAVPNGPGVDMAAGNAYIRSGFLNSGVLPPADDLDSPAPSARNQTVVAASIQLGRVSAEPVTRYAMVAYDDVFGIQYFQRNLRPYWRRNGWTASELLQAAHKDFETLSQRCARFDEKLQSDLRKAGGDKYADLAILAYRQTLAAHKLVADLDGTPLYFSKENFSNGCIDTVDVTYPSAPFFLYFQPALLKGQLTPVFDYASLPRWKWSFAPHDLGQYPLANGQVYGGGEVNEVNQMPVEESGNLLILTAALARAEGTADFAKRYWPVLTKWAEYLKEKGLDPENQLSTDDFAGHLAHNTNLSIKAILALRSYAMLAEMLGKADVANEYKTVSQQMASKWPAMAADGDHYRLAFDKAGTWSQKYNLVWDKLLGFHLFSPEITKREMTYYKTKQNAFGLPLDNRETYTKLDWIVWTATLADDRSDFETLIAPAYRFANESPTRVPLSDWYWTLDGKQRGFQARSVVGGVFIKMLEGRLAR